VEHGFRNNDVAYFRQFVREHGTGAADAIVDVIEPPRYEIVERMIQLIEQQYR
jgi:hypothetical protein